MLTPLGRASSSRTDSKKSLCPTSDPTLAGESSFDLLPTIDVVVENFSPGVMARLGLGYDDLKAANPAVIMASISGFKAGHQRAAELRLCDPGAWRVMHMTGDLMDHQRLLASDLPTPTQASTPLPVSATRRCSGERTGEGTHLDVSMLDAVFHMHEYGVQGPSITKGEWQPMRAGRHYQALSPGGTFKAPGGWVVIFCAQAQVAKFFAAITGQPELINDDRFATNPGRLEHRELP
ncbi:MAG: CoA transferase [Acidimicrobiales bacterium]